MCLLESDLVYLFVCLKVVLFICVNENNVDCTFVLMKMILFLFENNFVCLYVCMSMILFVYVIENELFL